MNDAGEDVFVHYQSIMKDGYRTLSAGQQVEFRQIQSDKGWQAVEVNLLYPRKNEALHRATPTGDNTDQYSTSSDANGVPLADSMN